MPEVYNWQLGRKMLYPYEERHPKWQFAFVFNINRCLACQTCSMADKSTWLFSKGQEYMWWNNVETKPYGGYPQFYDVNGAVGRAGEPGREVWNEAWGASTCAYGVFEGIDFERAQRGRRRAGTPEDRMALCEHLRGPGHVVRAWEGTTSRVFARALATRRACRSTRRSSSICNGSAITARIRGVWRRVRARRSTSGPKTGSS